MVKRNVRIDSKGRVLIPKEIRDKLELREGGVLKVYVEGNAIILRKSDEMKENPYKVLAKLLSGVTLDRITAEKEAIREIEKDTG
ncbi:MAG: AbrB/MazE/SpoVT family DNA-binding domain-containing protein [Thermoproteota archaeon]|nr:AbrB/MazE/SpoVT family DNA-binding domain-containing protein [Thermoproteota archaeon]